MGKFLEILFIEQCYCSLETKQTGTCLKISEFNFQVAKRAEALEARETEMNAAEDLFGFVIFGAISYTKSCKFSFYIKDKRFSRNVLNLKNIFTSGHSVIFCIKHEYLE